LGNADLSYKYSFFDGAVLPIGLGLSLILNAIFLARFINQENVLTLPDVLAKRYGKIVEVVVSCITIVSFLMLLAGNLVGMVSAGNLKDEWYLCSNHHSLKLFWHCRYHD
jgi:Na+/proline symporter